MSQNQQFVEEDKMNIKFSQFERMAFMGFLAQIMIWICALSSAVLIQYLGREPWLTIVYSMIVFMSLPRLNMGHSDDDKEEESTDADSSQGKDL
jgi:hypothetical protein